MNALRIAFSLCAILLLTRCSDTKKKSAEAMLVAKSIADSDHGLAEHQIAGHTNGDRW